MKCFFVRAVIPIRFTLESDTLIKTCRDHLMKKTNLELESSCRCGLRESIRPRGEKSVLALTYSAVVYWIAFVYFEGIVMFSQASPFG